MAISRSCENHENHFDPVPSELREVPAERVGQALHGKICRRGRAGVPGARPLVRRHRLWLENEPRSPNIRSFLIHRSVRAF